MNKPTDIIPITSAELVLFCEDLGETLDFYTDRLGFQLLSIFPADDPAVAVVSGFGIRIRLEIGNTSANENVVIRLRSDLSGIRESSFTDPNGVRFMLVEANPPLVLPQLRSDLVIKRFDGKADWIKGRAGMRYRDLIPDRLGGYMIASHIHIPDAGPVPDYVHFHKVHFQMIYCWKGWAKLVYEDQGDPFLFQEGDCVLQPPEIRHRVLESSGDLEVVEVSSPAEHETHRDHELKLPTPDNHPDRKFGGQNFVHHRAQAAHWEDRIIAGSKAQDTRIKAATNQIADVKIVRFDDGCEATGLVQDKKLLFVFVVNGNLSLSIDSGAPVQLSEGDSFVIPAEKHYAFSECSGGLEFLSVELI
ncbi:MAG: cupin [Acidobacteria bacterium]|nr:cupin [Acidobacteriota bacterium]